MGGLKCVLSKHGIVLSTTIEMVTEFNLRVGEHISALLDRVPGLYERRLLALAKTGLAAMFVHPILTKGPEIKWYHWRVEPFQGGECYRFIGSEIAAPVGSKDIDVYLVWAYEGGGGEVRKWEWRQIGLARNKQVRA